MVESFVSKVAVCSWSKNMEKLPGKHIEPFNKFGIPNYSESKIGKFPGRHPLYNVSILSLYGKIRFREHPYSGIFYAVCQWNFLELGLFALF